MDRPLWSAMARRALAVGVLACPLLGFGLGTQRTAAALGHHRLLGPPLLRWGGTQIYDPWRVVEWFARWGRASGPWGDAVRRGGDCALGGLLGMAGCVTGLSLVRRRQPRTTFGSARWATREEIRATGMLGPKPGVVLGSVGGQYLCDDGDAHILVFAPTGSGKSRGLVIPTLYNYHGPVIVQDIKRELWEVTSGFRSRLGPCYYYDPADPLSACQNPLLEVRKNIFEVRDAQQIATTLIDPEGSDRDMDFWEKTGGNLVLGLLLHALYALEDKSFPGMADFFTDPARTMHQTLEIMLRTRHLGDRPHPVVASIAREMLNKEGKELSGVMSTMMTFLGLYRDPVVARVLRHQDFTMSELAESQEPWTLYVGSPPSDIKRLSPLIRLFFQQLSGKFMERVRPRKTPVLMLMDEFLSYGHMDFFERQMAYMRGYGLRAMLTMQGLHQLQGVYGVHQGIMDNCGIRVMMAANDDETAGRISRLLGDETIVAPQEAYSGKRFTWFLPNRQTTMRELGRHLLRTDEALRLPSDEQVVLVRDCPPIRAKKINGWEDKAITSRHLPPQPIMELPHLRTSPWFSEGPKVVKGGGDAGRPA